MSYNYYDPTRGYIPLSFTGTASQGMGPLEAECVKKGGTWDPTRQLCVMPDRDQMQTPQGEPHPGQAMFDRVASQNVVDNFNAITPGAPYQTITQAGMFADDPVLQAAAQTNAGVARLDHLSGAKGSILSGGPSAQDLVDANQLSPIEQGITGFVDRSAIGTLFKAFTGNSVQDQAQIEKIKQDAYNRAVASGVYTPEQAMMAVDEEVNMLAQQAPAVSNASNLIADFEGFRDTAYQDSAGVWTIGYGRTTNPDGSPVQPGQTTTPEAEQGALNERVAEDYDFVSQYANKHGYDWTDNQKTALTSFVYNLGKGALNQVTAGGTRSLNEIANAMLKYTNAGGRHIPGLANRRNAEFEVFAGPKVEAKTSSGGATSSAYSIQKDLARANNNDDDGPSHAEIIAKHHPNLSKKNQEQLAKAVAKHGYATGGRNAGGMVGYNCGGKVMMNAGGKLERKIAKVYDEGYKAPGQAYAIAKSMGYNEGGMPMDPNMGTHPFEREGEEFDTVNAKLTPGEFVVDADSTEMFQPLLEAINEYEPGDDPAPINKLLSKKGEELTIKRKMKDGTEVTVKSPEGSELAMDEGLMTHLQSEKPEEMTTPMMNIGGLFDGQRSRAQRAAGQRQFGAGIRGGLGALGAGSDARASQLAGAGLRTSGTGSWGSGGYRGASFSQAPIGQTNFAGQAAAIGQGLQERGNVAQGLASELNAIDSAELAQQNRLQEREWRQEDREAELQREESKKKEKEQEALNKEVEQLNRIVSLASSAKSLVDEARPAIEFVQKKQVISSTEWAAIYGASAAGGGSIQDNIDALTGRADAYLAQAVSEGMMTQAAESAYGRLISDLTDMTTIALAAQGSGPKTDFDFEVAARSVTNLSRTPDTIKDQMDRMIENARRSIAEAKKEAYSPLPAKKEAYSPLPAMEGVSEAPFVLSDDRSAGPRNMDATFNPTNRQAATTLFDLDAVAGVKDLVTQGGKLFGIGE